MKKNMAAVLVLVCLGGVANADLVMITDRAAFEALGTIVYNYGFDDQGDGFSFPGDPWTTHGVTYASAENVVVGLGTGHTTNGTPMITNNYFNPVKGEVDNVDTYRLFGFDVGYMNKDDTATEIVIWTNTSGYSFNVDLPIASQPQFYGFAAGLGEYVTGFMLTTTEPYSLPGLDNVTVGHVAPVPGAALLGFIGMATSGHLLRRKKRTAATDSAQ